jgi:hypothetical protein
LQQTSADSMACHRVGMGQIQKSFWFMIIQCVNYGNMWLAPHNVAFCHFQCLMWNWPYAYYFVSKLSGRICRNKNTRLYIRLAIRIMINNVHLRIQYYIIEKNTMKLLYAWDLLNLAWERESKANCVRLTPNAWELRGLLYVISTNSM